MLSLPQRFVILELLIATDTAKVRLEVEATTFGALVRSYRRVVRMRVLTDAARPPRVYIEALSARQVPKSELLWPSRYKLERRALALETV